VIKTGFVFVSDCNKGLKPALKDVFPNNHEMSCAKHIEANVTQRYGNNAGNMLWQLLSPFPQDIQMSCWMSSRQ
jgi:hypothetical protein